MFYFGLFSKTVLNDGAQEEVNGEERAVDGGGGSEAAESGTVHCLIVFTVVLFFLPNAIKH